MNRFSTHVLDTAAGLPAAGMTVLLEFADPAGHWQTVGATQTDGDGRCPNLLPEGAPLTPGQYRLHFETGSYHASRSVKGFYPTVEVFVTVRPGETHLHVPLLLSPNGYTTYKGS
jgi:5-hydroxyisourate hydrolase